MTKKLLIIITILLISIISMFGAVCYADYDSINYNYNSINNNVTSTNYASTNQNTNINNLYTSGYRSIFSRYTTNTIHVKLDISSIVIEFVYSKSGNGGYNDFANYLNNNFIFEFVNYNGNNLEAANINYSNLNYTYQPRNNSWGLSLYITLNGVIEFDLPIKNTQLVKSSNANDLNFSNVYLKLCDTRFTTNNTTYWIRESYMQSYNYKIYYTLKNMLHTVDGFYLYHELNLLCNDSTYSNNFNYNSNYYYRFNNYQSTQTTTMPSSFSVLANLIDDSDVYQVSYAITSSGQAYYTYQFSDQYDMRFQINVFTPLFFNNNQDFIQAGSNDTITPLKLDYYDAKWYELHYQLANAFIFLITELPIISNITNAVYSTINVIQTAFNTLSEFSAFGYIFAFGMFALVFGILIKLLIGD